MAPVGYARTSTLRQNAGRDAQLRTLKDLGCEKVFAEKVSSVQERAKLDAALEYVREGDVFVVTKLDRLAHRGRRVLVHDPCPPCRRGDRLGPLRDGADHPWRERPLRVGRTRNVMAPTSLAGQFEQPYGPLGPPTLFTIPVLRYMIFSIAPAKAGDQGRAMRPRSPRFPL